MQVVETTLRPARIAFAFTPDASSRVLRRAFRLAGGRWGGRYDVLLCLKPGEKLSEFNCAALRAADPDYILVLDPRLDGYDLDEACRDLHVQPFEVVRLRERMEDRQAWRWLFRESPTIPSTRELEQGVIDIDASGVRWGRAAMLGFPARNTNFERIPRASSEQPVLAPVTRSGLYLSSPIENVVWAFYGPRSDIALASEYWTVRALGFRVAWRSAGELQLSDPPRLLQRSARAFLRASPPRQGDAHAAAARWTAEERKVEAWPFSVEMALRGASAPVFAQQILPVVAHASRLRFPTPPPPVVPRLPSHIEGVAVHRVLSPDADDPDGVILSRDPESRVLVQAGAPLGRRVTAHGVAEHTNLARPALIDLPLVHYEDALGAPLRAAGYTASHSDKGRYHQRTLQLARGLLFLNWILRQPQSARLLDLFFVRPQGAPATYRRAVTFADLAAELYEDARGKRSRLRAERRALADSWLREWTDSLLGRELLLAGYLLDCPHCSARLWYRIRAVDQTFTCARCDAPTVVPANARRAFRLNEAFFSFRDQGGHVVTFALARLRREANRSFLYYPETAVQRGHTQREIDAVGLLDGRLSVVEAKTNNTLTRREMDYYSALARRTRASRLIFATTSRSRHECGTSACPCLTQQTSDHAWDDGTRVRIATARLQLAAHSISVETWCYRDLVMEPPLPDLASYSRRS